MAWDNRQRNTTTTTNVTINTTTAAANATAKKQKHRHHRQSALLCFLSLLRTNSLFFIFSLQNAMWSSSSSSTPNTIAGFLNLRRGATRHRHLRRRFLPLVSLLLLFLFFFSFLSPPLPDHPSFPRRSLSSPVDPFIDVEKKSKAVSLERDLWNPNSSENYFGCSNASKDFLRAEVKTHPDRYLLISTSGGLNQQRTGITDAVAAAYILNATLIVPMLDQKSYWKDASNFEDIFDVDWFISFLSNDVKIIKKLPPVGGKEVTPVRTRVPRKCSPTYYLKRILPLLNKKHAVQLTKYDYRLSNKLETDLQRLRCRVNYHALRFTDPILEMGNKLVQRMRMRSKHFVTLHLRFEPDMLAFSGCDYGGGEKERRELGAIKKRWKTLHKINPDKQRRQGKCPLTPEEVGLMLKALGYDSDVHIYVASGEIYGGEETLAPLKKLFPNFYSKDTLATPEELAPFASYSARMAALDFIVCDESDVFVTNNNGNMAKILAGRRRYFGHKPTIRPNAKKLYRLFMNRDNMTWEDFSLGVRIHQVGFMGEPNEVKPGRGVFHEYPTSCICENSTDKIEGDVGLNRVLYQNGKEDSTTNEVNDEQNGDDEQDSPDSEDLDNENADFRKEITRGINQDPVAVVTSDQPEFEEWVSD